MPLETHQSDIPSMNIKANSGNKKLTLVEALKGQSFSSSPLTMKSARLKVPFMETSFSRKPTINDATTTKNVSNFNNLASTSKNLSKPYSSSLSPHDGISSATT